MFGAVLGNACGLGLVLVGGAGRGGGGGGGGAGGAHTCLTRLSLIGPCGYIHSEAGVVFTEAPRLLWFARHAPTSVIVVVTTNHDRALKCRTNWP